MEKGFFREEIIFRCGSIDAVTFNFAIQKLCTLRTSFCTITWDTIERSKIGGGHCRDVFIFGCYILHVIRTQCGPSEAVVYYFRYLTAARLPACFPLHSLSRQNSDVFAYIYLVLWKNMRAFFSEFSFTFSFLLHLSPYRKSDSENIRLAGNKY